MLKGKGMTYMHRCYVTILSSLCCICLVSSSAVFAQNKTLTRDLEPVVVVGADLTAHEGAPLGSSNELFLYAYRSDGSRWEQIPFQIDEVADSSYFTNDDGLLDGDDELAFMAKDAGDRADVSSWIADEASRSHPRVELAVSNPLAAGGTGWVYLYRSQALSVGNEVPDYVAYVPPPDGQLGLDAVDALSYSMGHADNGFPVDLTVDSGAGGVDLLDQFKLRGTIKTTLAPFNITETLIKLLASKNDNIQVKDGPVRVIRQMNATVQILPGLIEPDFTVPPFIYYPYSFVFDIEIPSLDDLDPSAELLDGRLSIDLNENAVNMKFVSANNPEPGFTVDGSLDTHDTAIDNVLPDNNWSFIGGPQGTIVHLFPLQTSVGGTRNLYYKDKSDEADNQDTGDKLSYGDTGVSISDGIIPPVLFSYRGYFLEGGFDSSIGAQIAEFEREKLSVASESQTFSGPSSVDGGSQLPESFGLAQNFPNPFNPSTEIHYQIGREGAGSQVTLILYNLLGQAVRTLVDEIATPGQFSVVWDGRNDSGATVPTGVYIYRLTSDSFKASRKLVLVK